MLAESKPICLLGITAAMMEEKQHEIGHLPMAAEIWMEARRLYMGLMVTDWTLTIMALVTSHYNDGENATAHITKMKTYHHDLLFMQHNIDDELCICMLSAYIYAIKLELCICSLAGALYISQSGTVDLRQIQSAHVTRQYFITSGMT